MTEQQIPRWQQRLANLESALNRLNDASQKSSFSDLERAGLIQTMNFTFELTWKTLKDLLYDEGWEIVNPRDVIRKAFEAGHLNEHETEVLLNARIKRNLMTHMYSESEAEEAEKIILNEYLPVFELVRSKLCRKRDEDN
ncbi:nucleotidyltransferase substrate binding protein [bacterium]|nr:nucleotidyltransferase substrate binding protein [bacterium]